VVGAGSDRRSKHGSANADLADDFIVKEKITMKTIKPTLTSLFITLAAALPAMAVPRVFVSGLGNDANPGSITSPKRSFTSALTVTDPGGEIIVLDSAGYGPVTINKAVSIISPTGVYAGVTVTSGDGITVSAGASDKVILRGLTINGAGGSRGIVITAAGAVHIENCVISGIAVNGILSDSPSTSPLRVFIEDTIVRDNSFNGIALRAASGSLINASIDRCRVTDNAGAGILAGQGTQMTIRDSVISENGGIGVHQLPAAAIVNVETCVVSLNGDDGIFVESGILRVSNSTVTDNFNAGFDNLSATFESRGNNTVRGNGGGDTLGTITVTSGT
jgi:parallel beta helix pectate lyase-like protein